MTETGSPRYIPIEDYGIIGDTCSAALVSRSGSIDWLAWPRFDSPSIFARLLDSDRGGFFSIAPVEPFESERHYLEDTNVLVTTFTTASGRFTVTDLMPAFPELTTERLTPFRSIIRRIEGVEGTVAIEMIYDPRIGYGQKSTRLSSRGNSTIFCARGQDALYLRSTAPLQLDGSRECARAKLRVARGETVDFSLAYNDIAPAVLPPLEEAATEEIDATIDYWESWADRINYDGPFSNMVRRSALTLKLLCYSPSGAVIAAPTTSLPEWIGGDRNWDYRFCWLRDASFTVRSLYDLHCQREAESYVGWLLHATRLSHPRLRVLYDVYGETRLHESEVDLDGYRSSRPVRTGNGAHAQKQLDVYGEVMGALMHHVEEGHELQRTERRFAEGLADYVADHWCEADDGIWEERAPRRQHVHAKVRCWAALVNAVRLFEDGILKGDADRWRKEAEEIREFVLDHGWSESLRSFTRIADGNDLDASTLKFSSLGFLEGDDPRMIRTIEAILERLTVDELVYRYRHDEDGMSDDEGAFVACSFWLVEALARAGRLEQARSTFRRLVDRSNDLGLYSEQIDPQDGSFLGNFPQGLSHLALIQAALTLAAESRERNGTTRTEAHRQSSTKGEEAHG